MDRRTVLKTGGMAVIGFGLGGCASSTARPQVAPVPRRRVNLAPIRASWDRVIRTTVGLRPHRPSGFRLEPEKFDDKLVIHNYGHGGAGLSLSWGTGAMAADMALEHGSRRAAVLGSGAVGLAATRQLQRRGFDVTIYAMAVPPNVTTNMAWGGFTPTSGLVRNRTPAWDAQFRTAVDIAYRQYQFMTGREYPVSWLNSYGTLEELPTPGQEERRGGGESEAEGLLPAHIQTGREILMPGEHPFPTPYATVRPSMRIEPPAYLNVMVKEVRLFGTKTIIRKFDNPRDLMSLGESVIVNCTGLGAKEIFGDEELTPVKGQLTFLVPQPEVDYQYRCMPRSDGIALGSTRQEGVWSLEPDAEARQRIVDRAIESFAQMAPPDPTIPLRQSIAPSPPAGPDAFFGEVS